MAGDKRLPTDVVVFSLVNGIVRASWASKNAWVELGHAEAVTYMMRDFLAQYELGERLARQYAPRIAAPANHRETAGGRVVPKPSSHV